MASTHEETIVAIDAMLSACEEHIRQCRRWLDELDEGPDMPEAWVKEPATAAQILRQLEGHLSSHVNVKDHTVKKHQRDKQWAEERGIDL